MAEEQPPRSRSSSRRSGSSLPGSVITFDPASLEASAELEEALNEPGFWDDQARAEDDLPSTRASRAGSIPTSADPRLRGRARAPSIDAGGWRRDLAGIVPLRRELDAAAGGGALQRRVRHRRCGGDAPVRHRRHRRAGLDRDDAADVRALGRDAASGSSCSRRARARRRGSRARRSRSTARTPTGSSRPSAASTVSCACARSTRRTAARPRSRR